MAFALYQAQPLNFSITVTVDLIYPECDLKSFYTPHNMTFNPSCAMDRCERGRLICCVDQ